MYQFELLELPESLRFPGFASAGPINKTSRLMDDTDTDIFHGIHQGLAYIDGPVDVAINEPTHHVGLADSLKSPDPAHNALAMCPGIIVSKDEREIP